MGQHIEAMSCPDCRNIVPLVVGGVNSFLNLFFNPCHQYRYCILLFFSCQLSSGRYMMPFEETSTAGARRLATKSSACLRMVSKPFSAKIINILRFRKIKYNMAFLFIIYYTFIELFFEFCHIFINFASKTIIKSYPLK